MTTFSDPTNEALAKTLTDSLNNFPMTEVEILTLIANLTSFPEFVRSLVDVSILNHLQKGGNPETIWDQISSNLDVDGTLDDYRETVLYLVNEPSVPFRIKSDIFDFSESAGSEDLRNDLDFSYNFSTNQSLNLIEEKIDQALFLFNTYSKYFDQIIPRIQTQGILDGLNEAKNETLSLKDNFSM